MIEYANGCGLLHDLLLVVFEDGQGKSEQDLAPLVQERVPDTQHGLRAGAIIAHMDSFCTADRKSTPSATNVMNSATIGPAQGWGPNTGVATFRGGGWRGVRCMEAVRCLYKALAFLLPFLLGM